MASREIFVLFGAALCSGSHFVLFLDHRLASVQEIRSPLRMGGGTKNRPLVFLQDFQPALDIGGVISARLGGQFQIGAEESRAKLGDQLFARIAFIAPFLASEFSVKAALVLRPVRLMPMSA